MGYGSRILFVVVIVLSVVSVGLVFLTQLRGQADGESVSAVAVPISEEQLVEPEPSPTTQPVRLLFGGDLMFDRNIRLRMQEFGVDHPLEQLTPLLSSYDAVIANLEGPITSSKSRSVGSEPGSTNNFFFTFQPEIVPMLLANNLSIVNLGNNHITNFSVEGIAETKQLLQAGGVAFFGNTGQELVPAERTHYQEFGQLTVAFVNLNQFTSRGFESALVDTKEATKSADVVIVMPHWGEEYTPEPNTVIQQQAHQLIDAGAHVIIGAHPHVIQSVEDYRGKRIYYSLGNFVFDQYFEPAVRAGWLVEMLILPDATMQFREIPIRLETNGQTVLQQ